MSGAPLALGDAWPNGEGVRRLSGGPFAVPPEWPLAPARLALDVGGEALLSILTEEAPPRTLGLDLNHNEFVLEARGASS